MKTEFKIFKSGWGFHTLEELIKEYQKEHHLEIKNVVFIKKFPDEIIFGVVFERRSENENK